MARTAVTDLQQQIEEVRREGFAAGYAAAMQAVREVASRSAPTDASSTAAPSRRGRGRARPAAPTVRPARSRRARSNGAGTKLRRSAARRSERGTNALIIEEILRVMAPSAVRPAEIRKALQDNGVTISFASIRHALGQLEARNAAERVGDSKTWRHRADES
jgi:hypothetical protein